MQKHEMTFGDYIKDKRMNHQPRLTLKKTAELLGINLTYLSDVENNRKKAFSSEKIELFCQEFELSADEREIMYDLAARDTESVPEDIVDTIMYTEQGDYARKALRMVNKGKGNVEMWKDFIRRMEGEE